LQALILAGGEATRLRPLTSTIPKPVVPLVDRPFISYMLEWLCRHGVDDVILACGFMGEEVRSVLGDGSGSGVRLRYVHEPRPLGTGGALKFAENLLAERFFMLNGDVLTDIDLTAQMRQHASTGARATLALVAVEDPSAYGLVRCASDWAITEFVEKPGPEEIEGVVATAGNLVNAGAYILERDVLVRIAPAGVEVSIEREVFSSLIGDGLFGHAASGYWLDIGTPERYLQATYDILEGRVESEAGWRLRDADLMIVDGATIEGEVRAPAFVGDGAIVRRGATVAGGSVIGRGVSIAQGTRVESSVILDGADVHAQSVVRSSIVGPGAVVGDRCRLEPGAVLGEGVELGPGNVLARGARIFPGVKLPHQAVNS